jgi:hypothetical protein
LASLVEARRKAQVSAFRSETNQFIIALELYKSDNGKYPNEGIGDSYRRNMNNSEWTADINLPSLLNKYLVNTPKIKDSTTSASTAYTYWVNNALNLLVYKCEGDNSLPPFVIFLNNPGSKIANDSVKDWKKLVSSNDGGSSWGTPLDNPCYSPK